VDEARDLGGRVVREQRGRERTLPHVVDEQPQTARRHGTDRLLDFSYTNVHMGCVACDHGDGRRLACASPHAAVPAALESLARLQGRALQLLLVAVENDQTEPLVGEQTHKGPADTAAATGDDCPTLIDYHHLARAAVAVVMVVFLSLHLLDAYGLCLIRTAEQLVRAAAENRI
jgi:hypothetical protein